MAVFIISFCLQVCLCPPVARRPGPLQWRCSERRRPVCRLLDPLLRQISRKSPDVFELLPDEERERYGQNQAGNAQQHLTKNQRAQRNGYRQMHDSADYFGI